MNLILHRIIETQDLGAWSRMKKEFFAAPYDRVYQLIEHFYKNYNKLPSFSELGIITRNERDLNIVKALELIQVPEDLETEILIQALINEYAQKEVLLRMDSFLTDLPFKDAAEIVENVNQIAIDIEEETEASEQIMLMNKYSTFDQLEIMSRIPLGINNDFDQHSLGLALSEMMMIGGYRGTGKSLVCSNIVCNQFHQGNSSLYFSIEMRDREIFQRNLSILSGVPIRKIKSGKLEETDRFNIAETRASMTQDGADDLLREYIEDKNFDKFEKNLLKRPLHKDKQIVTIDNPRLTIANIDATISSFKAKFPETLKVVVVDYLNKITERDASRWDVQINISKRLKELARKYEIVMVTPYQTHKDTGEARFSKGILDSPDWAYSLESFKKEQGAEDDGINFKCQKTRGEREFDFASAIDWDTLKLHPSITPIMSRDPIIKGAKAELPDKATDDL
jgi:replicative DNA helicase